MPALTLPAGAVLHRLPDNFREAKCPTCGRSDLMSIREWCERSGFSTVTGGSATPGGRARKVRAARRKNHHAANHSKRW